MTSLAPSLAVSATSSLQQNGMLLLTQTFALTKDSALKWKPLALCVGVARSTGGLIGKAQVHSSATVPNNPPTRATVVDKTSRREDLLHSGTTVPVKLHQHKRQLSDQQQHSRVRRPDRDLAGPAPDAPRRASYPFRVEAPTRARNKFNGVSCSASTFPPINHNHCPESARTVHLAAIKEHWQGDALYGTNPVLAALVSGRRRVFGLYVQEGVGGRKPTSVVLKIIHTAKLAGVPVTYVSKHNLNMLTENSPHQGVVLSCQPLLPINADNEGTLSYNESKELPVWIALDQVTDPHNLGAILRSAYFLGAAGVLLCAKNSAPLSPTVSKASAGAMEFLSVYTCKAMQKTLANAACQGWAVLGAETVSGAQPCSAVQLDRPTVLVMGSEGEGLRTVVKRACTGFIQIDSTPNSLECIDSLNVSVAAGILLHRLLTSAKERQAQG